MRRIGTEPPSTAAGPFHVSVQAARVGSCDMNPEVLSVRLAQHMLRASVEEMWNSVSIVCQKEPEGALVIRVMVFNPDWDGALQIAEIRSWPHDGENLTPLACNLNHVAP